MTDAVQKQTEEIHERPDWAELEAEIRWTAADLESVSKELDKVDDEESDDWNDRATDVLALLDDVRAAAETLLSAVRKERMRIEVPVGKYFVKNAVQAEERLGRELSLKRFTVVRIPLDKQKEAVQLVVANKIKNGFRRAITDIAEVVTALSEAGRDDLLHVETSIPDVEQAELALKESGKSDLVIYEPDESAIQKWAKYRLDRGRNLPAEFGDIINVHQEYKVSSKKLPALELVGSEEG